MFRVAARCLGILICGLVLLLSGCFPSPESTLDEERDPHYLNGRARAESQDYGGAVEEFEKAIEVNPRNAAAHFELGVLYENQLRDYAAAIYHYGKAVRWRPKGENAAKAAERIKVCKGDLAGAEFLPPTTQGVQRQLERLTLENKMLQQKVTLLEAQARDRAAAQARADFIPAPSQKPVTRVTPTPQRGNPVVNPAPVQKPQSVAAPTVTSYVVASGDTMGAIAHKLKVKVKSLEAANPNVDPHRLKVGQKLNVPPP